MPEADLRMRPGCMADVGTFARGMRMLWTPRGRSSRTELAMLVVIPSIIYPLAGLAIGSAFSDQTDRWLQLTIAIAIAIPLPFAFARRFHDMAKPGWLAVPHVFMLGIALWDVWLDVHHTHPASDLWYNRGSMELLFLLTCTGLAISLMFPPKDDNNPHGPSPRPAERTI